ncbi:hypothetical protein KW95_04210 [Clostridioides difficile]|nr:hypothetical protein KW95_04210 [Clostridioides difficile]
MGKVEKTEKTEVIAYYLSESKKRKVKISEMANKFNISEKTINNYIRNYKVSKEEIIDYYIEESHHRRVKVSEMANKFNMSEKTINNYIKDIKVRKSEIINYYIKKSEYGKVRISEMAKKFNVSEKTISNYIKDYEPKIKSELYDKVNMFFFEYKMSISDIQGMLNLDFDTIKKILYKNEEKYSSEIQRRREESQNRKKERNKIYKKSAEYYNEKRGEEIAIMAKLERDQKINAINMSVKQRTTNNSIVMMNINHYEVKENKNKDIFLVLNKETKEMATKDLPIRVKLNTDMMEYKTYEKNFAD